MNLFAWYGFGRTLLLTAVLVIGSVCVSYGADSTRTSGSGTFTDKRDGKKYKTVVIDGKTWMAQNLNFQTGKSWCYGDDNSNCNKYGRLYDWKTAKTACPAEWHLPSNEEWDALVKAVGRNPVFMLRSVAGWKDNCGESDEYGFSALPGGSRGPNGRFYNVGNSTTWWTATERGSNEAYTRNIGIDEDEPCHVMNDGYGIIGIGLSVRCVHD